MIEVGKTYNAWTVIEDLGTKPTGKSGAKRHFYLCECVCGTRKEVRSDNLSSGHSNGCGCLRKKLTPETWKQKDASDKSYKPRHGESIIGKTFGDLYVMEFDHTDTGLKQWFKCKCSCGNEVLKRGDYLRVNGVIACDECIHSISYGELAVRKKLQDKKVLFKEQVTFDNLVGYTGSKLRFDFVIYNKNNTPIAAIEFQGKQHYEPIEFFGGLERFNKQQEYDNRKRKYCINNNIILIEIPYNYNNLDEYLEGLYGRF